MNGVGRDNRIGPAFLHAGLGFGGAGLPADAESLIRIAAALGYDFKLLKAVVEINSDRAPHLVEMIRKVLDPVDTKVIGVLGLAFKPNTDDVRGAASVEVIRLLHEAGAGLRAYDPVAGENARPLLPASVCLCGSPYEAAEGADALVLVAEWNEFKFLNLARLRSLMRRLVIFDGRSLYEPERMRRMGFEYYSVGRAPVVPA